MESKCLEGTRSKVFLVLAKSHSALYRRLSLNVVREVCTYLNCQVLLGLMKYSKRTLKVLDVVRHNLQEIELEDPLEAGAAMCATIHSELLITHGTGYSTILDLKNRSMRTVRMNACRHWPGICYYRSFIYVFGGNPNSLMLSSCEKYDLSSHEWTNSPAMPTAKSAFTPCVYQQEIYLPASHCQEQQLEVFTPATEQYRLLPLRLSSASFGSVSFIVEGQLFHLGSDKRAYSWRLDSGGSAPIEIDCDFEEPTLMLSCGCVVRQGLLIYWANYKGFVGTFRWKERTLTAIQYIQ